MTYPLPYKTKQFFFVLIKISIVVVSFYFIYQKLINNGSLDISVFLAFLLKKKLFLIKNLIFLAFLSIFNWFLEIYKWQILVSPLKKINFKTAIEQSLGSFTASLFTPNRIGEYGARAIYFSKILRKRIVLINALGNMMQMSVTLLLGLIGFYFFSKSHLTEPIYYDVIRYLGIGLIIILVFVSILFKTPINIQGFSVKKLKQFISYYPKRNYILCFSLSLFRYVVFSFQFYYLLHVFGIDITYRQAMVVITTMYLLSSVIPTIFIFDVIIKGSIAVYLFALIGVHELTILSIVMLMWLCNFAIPCIFGSFYVLNFNFSKARN